MWRLAGDMFKRKVIVKHNYTFLSSVLFRKQRTWLSNKQKRKHWELSVVMRPLYAVCFQSCCGSWGERFNIGSSVRFTVIGKMCSWLLSLKDDVSSQTWTSTDFFIFFKERHHSKQTAWNEGLLCFAALICWGKQRTSYPIRSIFHSHC